MTGNCRRAADAVVVLTSLLAACGGAGSAEGEVIVEPEPPNLVDFARVEASATARTFLGLWPRETTDGPATVRDGDPSTSWKAPALGTSTLEFDFAPLAPEGLRLGDIEATWTIPPVRDVNVSISTSCGSAPDAVVEWPTSGAALTLPETAAAVRCVRLGVTTGPRGAALAELAIRARPERVAPAIASGSIESLEDGGVHVVWRPGEPAPRYVDVHFVERGQHVLSAASRVARVVGRTSWDGPPPRHAGASIVLLPVSADGTPGAPLRLAASSSSPRLLPSSGAIEGFYGEPWSDGERRDMVVRLARLGMGLYVYAPKSDPLHRADWRTPYDPPALARFAALRQLGERVGVRIAFGLSPGIDMRIDDPAERDTLVAKLAPFVDRGFRDFVLLFDDIEGAIDQTVDGALGRSHVDLANEVLGRLARRAGEAVSLGFTPTVYSTEREVEMFAGGTAYLDALTGLDPRIEVYWTGPGTGNAKLAADDFADVSARIGRAPILWENWYANDGGDGFAGKVYLAPYPSRGSGVVAALAGTVVNPMFLGALDRLAVGPVADSVRAPESYDPASALQRAVALETGAPDPIEPAPENELLLRLARAFDGASPLGFPGINLPRNPEIDAAIDRLESALSSVRLDAIVAACGRLAEVAAWNATVQSALHHSQLDVALVDDLTAPTDRFEHEGQALLAMLDGVATALGGGSPVADFSRTDVLLRKALHDRYQLSLFKANELRAFLPRAPLEKNEAFRVPPLATLPQDALRSGQAWNYRATAPEVALTVHGLPGAIAGTGTVQWIPPHAGRYRAVLVAVDASGFASRSLDLVVAP